MIDAVFIVGPTGIGKTEYAIHYALEHNGEIVSADSMQIYKYMNIGSAKPSEEELAKVKHYLIDEIDPRNPFNVYDYQQLALKYIKEIVNKGKTPIVCGGTGLYIHSLVYDMDFKAAEGNKELRDRILQEEGNDPEKLHNRLKSLDPKAAEIIHPNNVKRVLRAIERLEGGEEELTDFSVCEIPSKEINPTIIKIEMDRSKLYERINKRVDIMYDQGLVNEVKTLMNMGFTSADIAMKGIGYKEIIDAINLGIDPIEVKALIKQNTRHYAKRQMTWLKRYKDAIIIQK